MRLQPKDYSDPARYLWTDLPDASNALPQRARHTSIDALRRFIDEGYATIAGAVAKDAVLSFQTALYAGLERSDSGIMMTYWDARGKHHVPAEATLLGNHEAKVLDVHRHLDSSHELIFAPAVIGFLRDVFQDDPVAFQTLYFEYGSMQDAHNDTAFVYVDPPEHFVASWIALEDIAPETGELFYYPRSHKMGEQIFAHGGKAYDPADEHAGSYSAELERMAEASGLRRATFVPKQTDVLFWAADLIHGGSKPIQRRTRRSLVTHYCPLQSTVPYARHLGQTPRPAGGGGWILSAN